jgi:hypothetical protein
LAIVLAALRWVAGLLLPADAKRRGYFETVELGFSRLARRRALSVLLVGLLCLSLRAALLPILKIPVPAYHDEYSYLLAADTFAHGRLTNPTPPFWRHFESEHINLRPTYMSEYPAGQGLVLAAGQILGHPWLGVWLSVALMCAAICWMLQAWLPPSWALLGGVLSVLTIGTFSYWMNSYWGGAVAATGGALLLGAARRILRHPRLHDALLLGLALAILANSRPYEGMVLSLPVAVALFAYLFGRRRPPLPISLRSIVLPISLVLLLTSAAMGYYFWRVTGSPWLMPYVANLRTYEATPVFLFQKLPPIPRYPNQMMKAFYLGWERTEFERARTLPGLAKLLGTRALVYWFFYIGPLLTLALGPLPKVLRDRRLRLLLIAIAVTSLGLALESWTQIHYAAPLAAAIFAVVLQSMRHLRHWRPGGRPLGQALVRIIPLGCLALVTFRASAIACHVPLETWPRGDRERAALVRQLDSLPGRQLVFVHYRPDHNSAQEWVYNRADLATARVVWARQLDPGRDQQLIHYFNDRRVWIVDPDETPPRLLAYDGTASPAMPVSDPHSSTKP